MPHALTASRTSPGPAVGFAISTQSATPGPVTCTDRIVAPSRSGTGESSAKSVVETSGDEGLLMVMASWPAQGGNAFAHTLRRTGHRGEGQRLRVRSAAGEISSR